MRLPGRKTALAVVLATLAIGTTFAGAELVLIDGEVLSGVSVERQGDVFVLETDLGTVLTVPVRLVEEVRVFDEEDGEGEDAGEGDEVEGDQEPEEAEPTPPTGLTYGGPEVLAGQKVDPPRLSDQLEVFGEPSSFPPGPVDPAWEPTDAYDPDEDVLAPRRSTWPRSIVDSTWLPRSAFDGSDDVLKSSRSRWQRSIVDPEWYPTDGFRNPG